MRAHTTTIHFVYTEQFESTSQRAFPDLSIRFYDQVTQADPAVPDKFDHSYYLRRFSFGFLFAARDRTLTYLLNTMPDR
jgi:hypothetical protein